MMEQNTNAARAFFKAVRTFVDGVKPWHTNAIWYDTGPDEVYDLTKVSRRVYGRPDEFLAIMAAAGLDAVEQPLTQRRLVLPNEAELLAIKRRAGFESIPDYRENFAPIWAQG